MRLITILILVFFFNNINMSTINPLLNIYESLYISTKEGMSILTQNIQYNSYFNNKITRVHAEEKISAKYEFK